MFLLEDSSHSAILYTGDIRGLFDRMKALSNFFDTFFSRAMVERCTYPKSCSHPLCIWLPHPRQNLSRHNLCIDKRCVPKISM